MIICPLNYQNHNRVPTGVVQPYAVDSKPPIIPKGWLLCDGSIQSAVDYTELAVTIYNMFHQTERILEYNEFVLPDMQEKYLYPSDSLTDRIGSFISSENPKHTHIATCDVSGKHTHTYTTYDTNYTVNGTGSSGESALDSREQSITIPGGEHRHFISMPIDNTGGDEFNPKSLYLYYIIKY